MSFTSMPVSERLHIGFFGCRNAGKSSLVNAISGQNLSIVSDKKGTTTDAVKKTMELLPLGPVVIIDTAGFDDVGELGNLRVKKTLEVLRKTDIAVLVVDSRFGLQKADKNLINLFNKNNIPFIIAYNKCDILNEKPNIEQVYTSIYVSSLKGDNIYELKELLGKFAYKKVNKFIVGDLLNVGDIVILVIPIDESAPKGRLILPQHQTIRELLDFHCVPICCQVEELDSLLKKFSPKLVITDSQAFYEVKKIVPENIYLTSFSILMARYKGEIKSLMSGAETLKKLKDGDKVLISEGCTHHRQCNDIGSVKIPMWLKNYTGKSLNFSFTSGGEFPENIKDFALIVHCGGCMLNEQEMKARIKMAQDSNVPIINYGVLIANINGILERSLKFLKK